MHCARDPITAYSNLESSASGSLGLHIWLFWFRESEFLKDRLSQEMLRMTELALLPSLTCQIHSKPRGRSQELSWLKEHVGEEMGNSGPFKIGLKLYTLVAKLYWFHIPCYLLLRFGLPYNAFNACLVCSFCVVLYILGRPGASQRSKSLIGLVSSFLSSNDGLLILICNTKKLLK